LILGGRGFFRAELSATNAVHPGRPAAKFIGGLGPTRALESMRVKVIERRSVAAGSMWC
jgi:hypothetical protein